MLISKRAQGVATLKGCPTGVLNFLNIKLSMKISYNWLKEYVYFYLSPQELAERLTNVGLVVADIKQVEDDFCLDIEVTSNRPDCLGVIGIARDTAAAVGGSLQISNVIPSWDKGQITDKATPSDIAKWVAVAVEDTMLCPRYTAQIIQHVTIGPSPEWMQKRLKCLGLRPVNNVVDVTNYVMMETGQPLHAFDYDKIADKKIVVRRATIGEEIVTINGARRALFHDMLVIADGKSPIAVAGVMGGKDTEVTESTRRILLECALFEPRQVRRTSRVLGIASDSSYRFERGIDPEITEYASRRAANLIQSCAGGEVVSGFVDVRSGKCETKKITLRMERLNKIIGVEIKKEVAVDILKRLHFRVLNETGSLIDVDAPSFRGDVYREIDLIEEVARIYGYNNIPTKTAISVRGSVKNKYETVENDVRRLLTGIGFYEAKTFSIVDTSVLQSINLWSHSSGLDIANPLRQEESRLRTSLLPSLINVKRYNANHGTERVKTFEIAKVYLAGEKLPQEKTCLSILADIDFLTAKGIIEAILTHLGIFSKCESIPFSKPELFRDGYAARMLLDGKVLGYLGEGCKDLAFNAPPCLAELDMDLLVENANFKKNYQALPQHPPVFRDLALLVDEEITWASVEKAITGTKVSFLKNINFFDVYRGKQIPAGKKSIAFNLCFQAQDRTLKSEEVDIAQTTIIDTLHKTLNAELRTQ